MIKNILIIDDDSALARSLQLQLGAHSIESVTAGTAADGISALEKDRPDMILLDINLPDGNGLTVMENITEEYPDIPVVMVTARQDMATHHHSYAQRSL